MLGLEKEIGIFADAIVSGMMIYAVYTLIRVFRRVVKHTLLVISIEDFLFWVATGFYLFLQMYKTSNGSIRWFFVLGVVSGMCILASFFYRSSKWKLWKRIEKIKKSVDK